MNWIRICGACARGVWGLRGGRGGGAEGVSGRHALQCARMGRSRRDRMSTWTSPAKNAMGRPRRTVTGGGGGMAARAPPSDPSCPPPPIRKIFPSGKKMKFIKGARIWRSILHTNFFPLTPPPPVLYQPATKAKACPGGGARLGTICNPRNPHFTVSYAPNTTQNRCTTKRHRTAEATNKTAGLGPLRGHCGCRNPIGNPI